jgi:hypothetical protein
MKVIDDQNRAMVTTMARPNRETAPSLLVAASLTR